MALFSYEQIKGINPGEFRVYNFVASHLNKAHEMNIRQLAGAVGVSTTTVLRFCEKVGCSGYTELKYRLRQAAAAKNKEESFDFVPAVQYITYCAGDQAFGEKLAQAAVICADADQVILSGDGGSGTLIRYGAYLLNSIGKAAFPAEPGSGTACPGGKTKNAVLILSAQGDGEEIVSVMNSFRRAGAALVSITNAEQCLAARISDVNFSCYMPEAYRGFGAGHMDQASQIPVVYLLERLAAEVQKYFK